MWLFSVNLDQKIKILCVCCNEQVPRGKRQLALNCENMRLYLEVMIVLFWALLAAGNAKLLTKAVVRVFGEHNPASDLEMSFSFMLQCIKGMQALNKPFPQALQRFRFHFVSTKRGYLHKKEDR